MNIMFVWKLPPFFPHLHGKGKRAAISKLACDSQKRIRSYVVLALAIRSNLSKAWFVIWKLMQVFSKISYATKNSLLSLPKQNLLQILFETTSSFLILMSVNYSNFYVENQRCNNKCKTFPNLDLDNCELKCI